MNGLPYIEISAALMGVIGTLLLAGRSRMAEIIRARDEALSK